MKNEELRMNNTDKQSLSDQIEGRNSVLELLESDRDITKISEINRYSFSYDENMMEVIMKDGNICFGVLL